jgi:hypothetical protein
VGGSTSKKVVVHRFDRAAVRGYLDSGGGFAGLNLGVLSPQGTLQEIPIEEIKVICFVKDISGEAPWQEQRVFRSRPKTEGLWVQLEFRDGDVLQGVVPNNLLLLETEGVSYTPPDPTANNQRIFAPRQALRAAKVLGVIGGQAKGKGKREAEQRQIGLFE